MANYIDQIPNYSDLFKIALPVFIIYVIMSIIYNHMGTSYRKSGMLEEWPNAFSDQLASIKLLYSSRITRVGSFRFKFVVYALRALYLLCALLFALLVSRRYL